MIAQGMFKSQGPFSVLVSRGYTWRYCSRVSELGGYLSNGHTWKAGGCSCSLLGSRCCRILNSPEGQLQQITAGHDPQPVTLTSSDAGAATSRIPSHSTAIR